MLVAAIVLSVLITALHILTALVKHGRWRAAVGYINIFLHAPLLVTLVLSGADFEWGVLAAAASAFLYTLLRYIPYRLALEAGAENDPDSAPVFDDTESLSDNTDREDESLSDNTDRGEEDGV